MAGWVYFIQSVDGGPVKIGYAKDVEKRLGHLQSGSPVILQVVLKIESDMPIRLEQELHQRYSRYRIRGEWFDPIVIEGASIRRKARQEARQGGTVRPPTGGKSTHRCP